MTNEEYGNGQLPSYAAGDAYSGLGSYGQSGQAEPEDATQIIPPLAAGARPAAGSWGAPEAGQQYAASPVDQMQSTFGQMQGQFDSYEAPSGQPGQANEDMAAYARLMNLQSAEGTEGSGEATYPASHVARRINRHHWGLIISLCLLAAVIVALIVGFFGARSYYQDRAAPGVTFAGQSVAGRTPQELEKIVSSQVAASGFTVTDNKGGRTKAKLTDLGVQADVKSTVNKIVSAKDSNEFARVNPFQKQVVPLTLSVDEAKMNDYLTKTFIGEDARAVPSSVHYDEGSHQFVVQEGKRGQAPKIEVAKQAVNALASSPGQQRTLTLTYSDVDMPISKDVAASTADQANQRLAQPLVVGSEKGGNYTVPKDQVAKWIHVDSDLLKGQMNLTYDAQAIKAYADTELPKQLNQDMVPEKNVKDSKGNVLGVTTAGVDGIKVKNQDDIARQITDHLKSGKIENIQAAVDVEPHKVETRTLRTDVPDGDLWVEVNLSTQTATAYKGTTEVKSFPICSGLPRDGDESDLGTFFINIRYEIQTMRGPGYVSPNVKWVSYYNGSEGFHTADWNYDAIAHGDAANRGSHGCINMYEQDAKWIYDNCPAGTMVRVVGEQPTHAVR
ncbi:peptidoglycan-binding protein [Bombiscardovia nodaiensis]|uniref:Peptidoglycan-binding protein n=1 Tax=Bombiscardovia nodaiensis TaxID=2932181 RepID=A0ABM8B970_9BIFI|nr:peptidoglycan-binding protein [Bombiscardovia nodaiensis]